MESQTHHHYHHGHNTNRHDSIGENNKNHFDNVASEIWKVKWVADFGRMIEKEIKKNMDWLKIKGNSKMLDYACGNGQASKIFASHFDTIRGVDISSNMVKEYNTTAAVTLGFSPDKMRAIHADVVNPAATPSEDLSTPGFYDFDLIVMSMALHHVADPAVVVGKLAERLSTGGVILIVDWLDNSESGCGCEAEAQDQMQMADHPARSSISRHGFTAEEMKGYFAAAGLVGAGLMHFEEKTELPHEWGGSSRRGFLGRAWKG